MAWGDTDGFTSGWSEWNPWVSRKLWHKTCGKHTFLLVLSTFINYRGCLNLALEPDIGSFRVGKATLFWRSCRMNHYWLVVSTYPSEKWWSLSVGMIIPNIWKNNTCSKPPIRLHSLGHPIVWQFDPSLPSSGSKIPIAGQRHPNQRPILVEPMGFPYL